MTDLQQIGATSIVALFDTTKAERQSFVKQVLQSVDDGEVNPLKVQLQMKCMEDIIKQVTSDENYKAHLLSEAQKNGKSFDYHSSKIEVKEVGTKYDFTVCEDVELNELAAEAAELDKKIKARQAFLKNAPASGTVITDPVSGETYTAYPPAKSSTTAVAVTLK